MKHTCDVSLQFFIIKFDCLHHFGDSILFDQLLFVDVVIVQQVAH